MIDDAKLNEILALAEKATPGPYSTDAREIGTVFDSLGIFRGDAVARACPTFGELAANDFAAPRRGDQAAFFAACDPGTIKALVEELKEKRFRLESLEK